MASVAPPTPSHAQPHNLSSLNDFNKMPHKVDEWEAEDKADEDLINQLLSAGPQNDALAELEKDLENGAGEKADDAVDYGDISDDDLAEDDLVDDASQGGAVQLANGHAGDGHDGEVDGTDAWDDNNEFDDLFGGDDDTFMDDAPDSTLATNGLQQSPKEKPPTDDLDDLFSAAPDDTEETLPSNRLPTPHDEDDEEEQDPEWLEQQRLFAMAREHRDRLARGGIDPDALQEEESVQDTIDKWFPEYDREHIPDFSKFFFRRRAHYATKPLAKLPAKVQPTRPVVDLEADQERSFKQTSAPQSRKRTNEETNEFGLFYVQNDVRSEDLSDDNVELVSLNGDEIIGGVSVQDLRILCEDWDSLSVKSVDSAHSHFSEFQIGGQTQDRAPKRRKTSMAGLFDTLGRDEFPMFDDPEVLTAKLAKSVHLDLNDKHLLLDVQTTKGRDKAAPNTFIGRREAGGVSNAIHKKFNFSNDDEYERLVKENSIRAAVGNIPIEHSGPARRLQYPFYKTALTHREQRNFHRPVMHFPPNSRIMVQKRLEHKRAKDLRKQAVAQTYAASKDMTMADNSSMLLLEYSEECPLMLSNFGMNSRVINYYRRKDEQDKFRPKEEVGEPRVLMEKDQSPFAKFGFVDAGETVPTLHNNLYRAPMFKHDPKQTDFLVVRRQTGIEGVDYHMRNIENLHVVGQQFPFAEVPGTHGRKVTSTQKSRMKMIAFRIYSKKIRHRGSKQPFVPHAVITMHFPGSDVAQNRSKMRELMSYNKEYGTWEPRREDEKFLDMELLRNEIKPEDICLIDSMQVGSRQMQDAGFDTAQIANEKDDAADNQSLDAQLVHWRATKNFLAACGDNAMIALHGEGDPTGRGEGFSFVKISMKGGFQAMGASAADQINAMKKAKDSGHKYNVRDQEDAYQAAIRQIWDAQTNSLSATEAPDLDVEMDDNIDARIERNNSMAFGRTPRLEAPGTPGYFPRQSDIDDSFSHVSGSRISASDRQYANNAGKILKITRRRRDVHGEMVEETQIIDDPVVAHQYMKVRDRQDRSRVEELVRAGGSGGAGGEVNNPAERAAMEAELIRLKRNMERRKVREAQKAAKLGLSTGDSDGKVLPGQTQRKCANCGQLGHIKTNKKLCPMLNGSWPDGVPPNAAGAGDGAGSVAATPGPGSEAPTPGTERPAPMLSTSFQF